MKIIITGEPGIGKTTLIKKLLAKLGKKAVGFYTEEVRDKRTGRRKGFKVVDTEGNEALFASKTFTSRHLVGSYGVNVERFERIAIPILAKAVNSRDRIVVIDEVGRMELFSKKFRDMVRDLVFDPSRKAVVTIPIRDVHPLVKEIRRLEGSVLIELTKENRDFMDEEILKLILPR